MDEINPVAVNSLKCERNLSATCKDMRKRYTFFDKPAPEVDDSPEVDDRLQQIVMKWVMRTTQ